LASVSSGRRLGCAKDTIDALVGSRYLLKGHCYCPSRIESPHGRDSHHRLHRARTRLCGSESHRLALKARPRRGTVDHHGPTNRAR
jgi:hypothetical protein